MTIGTANDHEAGDIAGPVRTGDVVAEKYLIERTIGVGGMGIVVAARDQVLERRVAIKFLLPKLAGSETAVQRFLREARASTRLGSEHVVRLLEIEKLPSGTPFFVMEYLEGSDLRALLREQGPLAPQLAVDYVLQALQAIAEGHVRGVVHRDIKPGNLFLTARADGTPLIKVLDFGIAKTIDPADSGELASSLTSSDDVRLGSPAYMPPEQLQNPRDVDTRSDIWSVGATLYELICGRPPFEGQGYLELATRILSQPPPPLASHASALVPPPGLETVIRKCLAKERSDRYRDAAELASALAPYGSDDARISLTRVRGTLSSMSSLSAVVRSLEPSGAVPIETTLPVATDPALPHERTATSPTRTTANISTPAPPRSKLPWLIAAVALVAALSALALRTLEPRPAEALPDKSPASVADAAVAGAAIPLSVVAPDLSVIEAPAQPASSASSVSSAAAPKRAEPAPRLATRKVSTPTGAASAEPPVPEVSVPPPAPSVDVGGRSDEIERLIERRR